jgi:hypothetical protein
MKFCALRSWPATFLLLCTIVSGSRGTPWEEEVQTTLQTNSGRFEIVSIGTGGQLRLNGRLLQELDESDASIARRWPDQSPQFLLLDLPTDGGSCPELYRLLDLSVSGKPSLTRPFGNCHVSPTLQTEGDKLSVYFPATPERAAGTWTYDPERRRLDDPLNDAVTGPLF